MVAAREKSCLGIQKSNVALLVGKFARLLTDLGFPTGTTCWRASASPRPNGPPPKRGAFFLATLAYLPQRKLDLFRPGILSYMQDPAFDMPFHLQHLQCQTSCAADLGLFRVGPRSVRVLSRASEGRGASTPKQPSQNCGGSARPHRPRSRRRWVVMDWLGKVETAHSNRSAPRRCVVLRPGL